ncbi:hypothetical protein NK214_06460 [Chromobacterium sp. S0633]|uniref:hypothetical protein n=1 Tax=Chromobacterium sp. S0633 TaxID=2957805 RepID=UPI00209F1AAB|nr:hypothetical protein [Chromobacterium sp. S0633]MCP1289831.1 hypothetical protein [Chromobacterium sp. S0633]
MSSISANELSGNYQYSWQAVPGDNPKITGTPDSNLLSTTEGYEVIDFINGFLKNNINPPVSVQTRLPTAHKIEKMIHLAKGKVADHKRSTYVTWIVNNWSNH